MAQMGDNYTLHSSNGMDYKIRVVNVNEYRPPEMKYAADVWDGNGTYAGDVQFFGDDFLEKCEFVGREEFDCEMYTITFPDEEEKRMRVNCIDMFNLDKFRDGIERFEALTDQKAYAFMSNDTGRLLEKECELAFGLSSVAPRESLSDVLGSGQIAEFEGTKIYIDDDLPLGIVELGGILWD